MHAHKTLDRDEVVKTETLGSLRLRHHQTNEVILIPTPTKDPNDPLNWWVPRVHARPIQ